MVKIDSGIDHCDSRSNNLSPGVSTKIWHTTVERKNIANPGIGANNNIVDRYIFSSPYGRSTLQKSKITKKTSLPNAHTGYKAIRVSERTG